MTDDMLGVFAEFTPKFVKRYRELGDEIRGRGPRIRRRRARASGFPAAEHTYSEGPRRPVIGRRARPIELG